MMLYDLFHFQAFISQGSVELFSATENLAYIDSVSILLPSTWKSDYNATLTSEYFYEDGDIRINSPNPLYLDNPYTLQSGGCGERGKYIYLTPGTVYILGLT